MLGIPSPHFVFLAGKNKRVGKQLASQKILQLLHPHVKNWGSLLRMYGRESSKMVKQVTGPPPWSTCFGSRCPRGRVGQLCSCSVLPLGPSTGHVCDLGGWEVISAVSPSLRSLGLALATWEGLPSRRCRWWVLPAQVERKLLS